MRSSRFFFPGFLKLLKIWGPDRLIFLDSFGVSRVHKGPKRLYDLRSPFNLIDSWACLPPSHGLPFPSSCFFMALIATPATANTGGGNRNHLTEWRVKSENTHNAGRITTAGVTTIIAATPQGGWCRFSCWACNRPWDDGVRGRSRNEWKNPDREDAAGGDDETSSYSLGAVYSG